VKKTTNNTSGKVTSSVGDDVTGQIFVTIASRQKQIMTSQNRRARPFYKPPPNLQHTLHAVPHLHSKVFIRCSPTRQRCRETWNESI